MAYIAANTSAAALDGRVTEFFSNVRQSIADRRLFARTVKELNELQDRELADLGIYRGDIRSIAQTAVYGN